MLLAASVGDSVWFDGNPNGLRDAGEHGLADLAVNLYVEGGVSPVASTQTGLDGSYLFEGLDAGSYFVEFVAPPGFGFTTADQGGDDALDSDANQATGRTPVFALAQDEQLADLDAGLVNTTGRAFVYFDFTLDANGFFDTQEKRDLLRLAADTVVGPFDDALDPIVPTGPNTWDATINNPATGDLEALTDLILGQNELLFFAGGRAIPQLGVGGPGGFLADGLQGFLDNVSARGQGGALDGVPTDFGPWGGAITFDLNANWFFGETTQGLSAGQSDFLSVAIHELTHGVGFGTAASFDALIDAGLFTGPAATVQYDGEGNPPLAGDLAHWDQAVLEAGVAPIMVPSLLVGTRNPITLLDFAALRDLGWEVNLFDDEEGPTVQAVTLSDDTGLSDTDRLTSDETPTLTVTFSEFVVGDGAGVNVQRPGGALVVPQSVVFNGDTLTLGFNALPLDGQYTVTLSGGGAITDAFDNLLNDGQDQVITFTLDTTAPSVTSVSPVGVTNAPLANISVLFADANGLDEATVTDPANYVLLSSGGDGSFLNGNELNLSSQISNVAYNPATKLATLTLTPALNIADTFQLRVKGTATVLDAAGNVLNNGVDHVSVFSLQQPIPEGSIAGVKFEDANANGRLDIGEPGIVGVEVFLDANANGALDDGEVSTLTGPNGVYLFNGLLPGTYRVAEVLPDGFVQTTPQYIALLHPDNEVQVPAVVSPAVGSAVLSFNPDTDLLAFRVTFMGLVAAATDLSIQRGSAGGNGPVVYDLQAAASVGDGFGSPVTGVLNLVTDALASPADADELASGGLYVNLSTAAYPNGEIRGQIVASSAHVVELAAGQNVIGRNFGNLFVPSGPASVGDRVFSDLNANGIQDADEPGIEGVQVELLDAQGMAVAAATTDETGNYLFADLDPGDYALRFTAPAGHVFTLQDQGASDALDSDVDRFTGVTPVFTLGPGAMDTSRDAGLVPVGSISGSRFNDANRNGVRDFGEAGLPGAIVFIDANVNGAFDAGIDIIRTTDADGHYSFDGLTPGTYNIGQVLPLGVVQTTPHYTAVLTAAREVQTPAVDSPAVGIAYLSLSPSGSDLRFNVSFTDLVGGAIGLNIHRGVVGANGPVVYDLQDIAGLGDGFVSPVAGVFDLIGDALIEPADADELHDRALYLNLNTDAFPEGEIRGQIVPGMLHVVQLKAGQDIGGRDFGIVTPVPEPRIAVSLDGEPVPDDFALIDFGSLVLGGPAASRTFQVTNVGTANLGLGNIMLPAGFELVKPLPAVLGPGATDTFTVRLITTVEGPRGGELVFTTTDIDANPFNIPVVGVVTDVILDEPFDMPLLDDFFEGDASFADDGSGANNILLLTEGSDAAWGRTIDLPQSAQTLSFDYRVTQAGDGDELVVALDGDEVFVTALNAASAQFQSTGPIDILGAGGGQVMLEVRLRSAGAANAAVQVENLTINAGQFQTLFFDSSDSAQYIDDDGDAVTVSLRGAGQGQVLLATGGGDAFAITLDGTDARSSLIISTTSNNQTSVTDLTVNGDINSITAKITDILGDVVVTGGLKKAQFDDIAHDHRFTIGPPASGNDQATLQFDNVRGLVIDSASPIKSLTATQWLAGPDGDDAVIAPSLGKLNIRGSSRDNIAGHFEAALVLSGQGTSNDTLSNASIRGSLRSAVWDITGNLGQVKVSGDIEGWTLNLASAFKQVRFTDADDMTLNVSGDAGKVVGGDWIGGGATAQSLAGLSLKGDAGIDLNLTGNSDGHKPTLGNSKVGGTLLAGTWAVAGDAGSIKTDAIDPGWVGQFVELSKLTVNEDLTGLITADTVGQLTTRGAITAFTLRAVSEVGRVTANSIADSLIFVGLPGAQATLPTALGDFVNPLGELGGLTLKGGGGSSGPAFVNSLIAAASMGGVRLDEVSIVNGGVGHGVAAGFFKSLAFESAGQGVKLTNADSPDLTQQLGDFFARVL